MDTRAQMVPTVLLVEDDPGIRNLYSHALQNAGFQVYLAENAVDGLQIARTNQPQYIVLDMLMPGLSGADFLKQLELKKTLPRTKLIVLSNIESPVVKQEALELGALKYLIKVEITPHQLVDTLRAL